MSPANLSLNAQSWGSESSDNITIADANMSIGREVGDNSRLGYEENETQDLGFAGDNPLGTVQPIQSLEHPVIKEDADLKLEEVKMRFYQATKLSLKSDTQKGYFREFERVWEPKDKPALEQCAIEQLKELGKQNLAKYTKQQLRIKGKQLLIDHLETIPEGSRRTVRAKIQKVWKKGLDLPWPVDKDDMKRPRRVKRCETPDDSVVNVWAEAMANDPDPFSRLEWLLPADLGLRPSHICNLPGLM